jgi:phospho-N-acetylmuramoyl-pentapeptide-transferase
MGGILIISSIAGAVLLWAVLTNWLVWIALLTLLVMGLIGFADDYLKLVKRDHKGLPPLKKLFFQSLWVTGVGWALLLIPETREHMRELMVPFLKTPLITQLSWLAVFGFLLLVVVGSSNAVNLTDGLDGLAIGCTSSVAFAYLVMTYAAGHVRFAGYLQIPYIPGSGELAVFCGCMLGACLGFLWFNCHPAQIFMGDTGSLALGGALGVVAVMIKQELVLMVVGGMFVFEALSVILQVGWFKLKHRRIFACAPLHHHFEMKKIPWSETQVTVRFWILSIIFALLGILLLKIR